MRPRPNAAAADEFAFIEAVSKTGQQAIITSPVAHTPSLSRLRQVDDPRNFASRCHSRLSRKPGHFASGYCRRLHRDILRPPYARGLFAHQACFRPPDLFHELSISHKPNWFKCRGLANIQDRPALSRARISTSFWRQEMVLGVVARASASEDPREAADPRVPG